MRTRIPGLLYLTVIITGIFSIAYAPGRLFASTDPAAIAAAVSSQLPLLRAAIVVSVACYVAYLLLPLSLYPALAPAGRVPATLMVAFVAVSIPISLANVGHWLEILALVEGRGAFASWPPEAMHSAIALADARHGTQMRVATIFWGLWLIPLGLLGWRSGTLPRIVCVLLVAGGVGYPVAILGSWLSPEFAASAWPRWITRPATLGEFSTCAWLLFRPPGRAAAAAPAPAAA
jgi:hypothetical protein